MTGKPRSTIDDQPSRGRRRHRAGSLSAPAQSAPALSAPSQFAPALFSAVLLALMLLALAACGGGEGAGDEARRTTPAVEALPARSGGLPLTEELSGVVKARNQVAIRPEIEATVVSVLVRSGERVERGQPLVRLDATALGDQVRQAEASLRLAEAAAAEAAARVAEVEAQASRTRVLHGEELVSDLELETREAQSAAARARAEQSAAQVEEARASVAERRTEAARTVVRSPVAGRVGQRNAEAGMVVDPGNTLFLVGDLDELIVEVPLTEGMLAHVEEGTPVEVHAASLGGEPLAAEISRISPFLEAGSFSTTAEIDLANPDGRLRPGMFVSVDVRYGESDRATLLPASALWEDPESGELGVYVLAAAPELPAAVENGTEISEEAYPFELRQVEVEAAGEAMVGVTGVEPGEWVVTVGQQLLYDAARGGGGGRGRGGGGRGDGARPLEDADGAPPGPVTARVRGARWEEVLRLQRLQREDLLQSFLAKQRTVARALGAEVPDDPAVVDEVMAAAASNGG